MKDSLKQYSKLKRALTTEKAKIEARLHEINQVLGDAVVIPASKPAKKSSKRSKNKLSLKAAVVEVAKAKPLTKDEILKAVEKIGYRFATKDPMNSLNTVLYTGKQFKNVDGRFSPAK